MFLKKTFKSLQIKIEIHGIPENIFTSTEEVVLKVAEAVNVPVAAEDIEISHKLRRRNLGYIKSERN